MDQVVHLDKVSVLRGGARILDGVDWSIEEGDRWVVLGANGSGKTTLLQVLAGLLYPTSGTVHLLGERLGAVDVFDLRPRIGLASVALAERLPTHETVGDVVLTAAYAVTGRWKERYDAGDLARAHALLAQLGVSHLMSRTFGTLSEGERKRVQIARALMTDPELLLLDEPAAGVDVGGREDLVGRLSRMALDVYAPTSVLVTHHVEEIPPGYTHVLMLRAGRVFTQGPLERVMNDDAISATFNVGLRLSFANDRWTARLR